jgi:ATP-dependent RNA helicase DeaD
VEDQTTLLRSAMHYGISLEKRPVPTAEDVSARVSERLIVMLENLFRERTNLERERLQRFIPLVQELAREEPELLAMFVDEVYLDQLNASEEVASPPEAAEPRSRRGPRRKK